MKIASTDFLSQMPAYMPAWRRTKDRLATLTISAGGASVLMAILLIFFYLVYEVVPLFAGASVSALDPAGNLAGRGEEVVYLAVEEQAEIGVLVETGGELVFVDLEKREIRERHRVSTVAITAVAEEGPQSRILGLGLADGTVKVVQHNYKVSYPEDVRHIAPRLDFPEGQEAISLLKPGDHVMELALRSDGESMTLAALGGSGDIAIKRLLREEDFLSGEIELQVQDLRVSAQAAGIAKLYIGIDQRWLYLLMTDGGYSLWDLDSVDSTGLVSETDRGRLFDGDARLSASSMLLGGISLLVASDQGDLEQYFVVRSPGETRLQPVRTFDTDGQLIIQLLPEHRRKGFLAITAQHQLQIYHSTAHRRLLQMPLDLMAPQAAAISPRADQLLLVTPSGELLRWHIENRHPDISWSALWSRVWYESYPEPDYIWQSSASNNDFEPKYSFSPLAFGTLKAAFYAMLVAAPLAVCGAIYTAYFMAPALRRKVKPMIELMEALPTVILGFLAGLWLAPFVEANLTGVFTLLLVLPVGVLLFAWSWSRMPVTWHSRVPEGWHAAILIPVVCLLAYVSFAINDTLELLLFGGDMRVWITQELGVSFDQRNALVVGIAMGMAVIPTIFSISEDALFSVPRHLSDGSLALGATPWQTLVGVVLPTASPGIFSGLMIGLGRAVGETMIVLMATGNTPIMDANIFEGMRTLAANIAVEVPEAEVNSTHYRVLFLAAFVLFLFTFLVNTMAELIRQRLRVKYGSL